jgi:ATP-dependent Lon protease
MEIIKYANHIAPNDTKMIFHLLFGYNWQTCFKYEDNFQLMLINRLFNPIIIWDSSYHVTPTDYQQVNVSRRVQFGSNNIIPIIEDNVKTSSIVIGDINAFPMFLKSLSELVNKEKKNTSDRKIDYDIKDLINLFKNKTQNIIYTKNDNNNSLIEEKNGFNVIIRFGDNERFIVLQGFTKDDNMELYKTNNYIYNKFTSIKKIVNSDKSMNNPANIFIKNNYLECLNIRDILIYSPDDIIKNFKKRLMDYNMMKSKQFSVIINDFLLASKFRKLEMIIIFLCGDENDNKLAYILYDILKMKDKKDIVSDIYNSLPIKFKVKLDETEDIVNAEEEKLVKNNTSDLSYERRINMMNVQNFIKDKAIEKLKSMKGNFQGDNKAQSWLDGLLKIPFNIYKENKIMNFKNDFIKKIKGGDIYSCADINKIIDNNEHNNEHYNDNRLEWNNYNNDKSKYLTNVHKILDEAVYGHKEAKLQLERLFAQWINGTTKGAVIGLHGPPGTGKTSLAKNGISKCLLDDDNKPRPFAFLPIGGSVNGSTLVGHNFTYVGSTWGRIADILMTTECMNPIIFIDEVDKISNTEYGKEITAILTHLTDATQNDNFEDKYFSGIPLDLSKALIIFSFNDISLLDPILRDRITVVETNPYNLKEKIHILMEYMIPEVLKDVGFNKNEIIFTPEIITYLIETFTNEAGVRKIKEKIVEIIRDINLKCIHNNMTVPYNVTKEYVDELFKNKPKVRINKIHNNPEIGLVNGLYATSTGTGGLTVIQVMKYPSDKMLDLTLTGQQGDVMKESVSYALRIAYSMLSDEEQKNILDDAKNKNNFGLLVHTPEAATKKDGPSAGAAMTLAIYSILTKKKINNTIAMTGEIDLCKNVRAIGGVHAKLTGAKAAGIKLALIPKENLEDLEILRNEKISPEDDNFKVELIETFEDVIKKCLV